MDVGKDAYVTVEGADEYVRLLLRPYDDFRVFWNALTEEEKQGYLLRATQQIDALTYTGFKRDADQPLQFPRGNEKDVSDTVKRATVFNALGFMNDDLKATADKQLQLFKSLGVLKNPRLDQTSQQAIAATEKLMPPTEVKIPIASATAYGLLKPYMRGGFSIR